MMIHGKNSYTYEGKSLLEDIGIDGPRFLRKTEPDRSLYNRMGLGSAHLL